MELFKANAVLGFEFESPCEPVDLKRILGIADINTLTEKGCGVKKLGHGLYYSNEIDCAGLWVLPAFVNHSCSPNAGRLHVGDNVFIHAARDLKAGEEVTFAYFDVLLPLGTRRELCKTWSFVCRCHRCELERSLESDMRGIEDDFGRIYKKLGEMEMTKLALKLEQKLTQLQGRVKAKDRQLIRASFAKAYWPMFRSPVLLKKWGRQMPCIEGVIDVVTCALPGDETALCVAATIVDKLKVSKGLTPYRKAMDRALRICKGLYGKQMKSNVMKDLIDAHVYNRAAVAWGPGQPLKIEEVQVAPPQAMEVRIKVYYAALCRTDFVFWEAKGQTPLFPRIFGHEAAGVVESVGEGVTDLKPGDKVLPVFTGECKECRHCKSVDSNMCDLLRVNSGRGVMISDGKSRFSIDGKPIYHFFGTSTFSEYTVVHVGCVAKINPDAPLDKVCILSCGVATGMGATLNVGKPKKGSTVAIFGLGSVGLAAAEGARIAGASRIIGIGSNSAKFEQAKLFGVTEFINPADYEKPIQQVIAERTDGGVDCSIECTGNVKTMIQAFESCHDGWGVSVLVGVPHAEAVFATHPVNFLNERTLKGTFFGNYKPRSDLPGLVEMYLNKELELDKFITHEVSFADINKAFDYMTNREGLRTVIKVAD